MKLSLKTNKQKTIVREKREGERETFMRNIKDIERH